MPCTSHAIVYIWMAHAQRSMPVHLAGFEISYLEGPLRLAQRSCPCSVRRLMKCIRAGETKENAELEETLW